jgi:glyoxylase-like metal-dependent hydrolase (beta-lactamase superfamily II)
MVDDRMRRNRLGAGILGPLPVVKGVFQIRALGSRVTLLADEDGLVLVDAGGVGSRRLISVGLRDAGYSMDDIRLVAVTHYHPDHTGGLEPLSKASIPIAAHEDDAPIISREVKYPNPFKEPALGMMTKPLIRFFAGRGVPVAYRLGDGDALPTAEGIRIVHTPGHTPGSMCLYVESKKLLIVGDALQYSRGVLTPPARWVTHDFDLAVASLNKLLDLDFETICFSHFSPMREGAPESLKMLIDDHEKGTRGRNGGI